jgi:hypothetical protein
MNNFIKSTHVRLTLLLLLCGVSAQASEWQRGDVFVAIGNGQYQVYRQTGTSEGGPIYTLIETITDGSGTVSGENGTGGNGFTTGCAFDSTSHLYTTNFTNANVYKFTVPDPHTVSQPPIAPSSGALSSESIVFDGQGNFFVGHADGNHVVDKFSPSGTLITSFTVATEDRGSDWIELSADANTLYYTSEGTHVKTFDLLGGTQGGDLIDLPSTAFAIRLLPPSFGAFAGDFLVADSGSVKLISVSGEAFIVQSYTIAGQTALFTLGLDINGTSFWVGDIGTGNFYRINVASGQIEVGPITIPSTGSTPALGGICVNGAAGAAQPQPVVQTVSLDPTHNSGTVNNDNNSNSWTITLNGLTTPATATIAFTEIPQSAGNSDVPGYGACELASADGTKCTVHQVNVDTTNFSSIDFYHHWAFKPPTPINPRMIKNGSQDITTAVYLDPGTVGRTKSPSTYTDNEASQTTGSSCGFSFPPNNFTWEAEFPLTFLFRAVSTGGNCKKGPYLTTLSPTVSLGQIVSGTVVPVTLKSTSFKLSPFDRKTWYYVLNTRTLQPGTYVVSVFDQSNRIRAFSEQINIVPED